MYQSLLFCLYFHFCSLFLSLVPWKMLMLPYPVGSWRSCWLFWGTQVSCCPHPSLLHVQLCSICELQKGASILPKFGNDHKQIVRTIQVTYRWVYESEKNRYRTILYHIDILRAIFYSNSRFSQWFIVILSVICQCSSTF